MNALKPVADIPLDPNAPNDADAMILEQGAEENENDERKILKGQDDAAPEPEEEQGKDIPDIVPEVIEAGDHNEAGEDQEKELGQNPPPADDGAANASGQGTKRGEGRPKLSPFFVYRQNQFSSSFACTHKFVLCSLFLSQVTWQKNIKHCSCYNF